MDFNPICESQLITMKLNGNEITIDVTAAISAFDVVADCRIADEKPFQLRGYASKNGFRWTGADGDKYYAHIHNMGKEIENAFMLNALLD